MKCIYKAYSYRTPVEKERSSAFFFDNGEGNPNNPILIKTYIKRSETKSYNNSFATETEKRDYLYEEIESEEFLWDFETLIYVLDMFKYEALRYNTNGSYCYKLTILFSQKFRIVFHRDDFSSFIERLENVLEKYKSNGICHVDKGVNNKHIYFYSDLKRVVW